MESLTIIAIDDDRRSRDTVVLAGTLLAQQLGTPITVLTARTGVEGIALLERQQPGGVQLVVLDIHLPGIDLDGRLIGPYIRETYPCIPILPFTGDRDGTIATQLIDLGMEAPVIKPIQPERLAERMAHSLGQRQRAVGAVALQPFLAAHARQFAGLLQQRQGVRTLQLALFSNSHLNLAGLSRIFEDLHALQPVVISAASSQPTPVIDAIRSGHVDLLVCVPATQPAAATLAATHGVPLLIYADATDAAGWLNAPQSLVVGPTSAEELAHAVQATITGERYRNAEVAAVLGLSPRQHTIITMLLRGSTTAQIAAAVGLSEHRLRHIISALYDQLGLVHSRAALMQWAQRAPLRLLER
jgi:DNA-binding NarL/FixJ family response regulator